MTQKILYLGLALLLCSCSHTLKFPNNHFAVPITAEDTWNGHISVAATGTTHITVLNDYTSNPPVRDKVLINEDKDLDLARVLFINNLGVNGSLGLMPSIEAYYSVGTWGLRWQFLNHGSTPDQWVAAVQAGYGRRDESNEVSSNGATDTATSDIVTKEAALSVGYRLEKSVPYVSYVYNVHDVTTNVKDTGGAKFGPYDDHGVHQSLSLGITTYQKGADFGLEASITQIEWDRSNVMGQFSVGGKIGLSW